MTTHHPSPEDAFDRWLDDLVDGTELPIDDERSDMAAFLQRTLGLHADHKPRIESQRSSGSPSPVPADDRSEPVPDKPVRTRLTSIAPARRPAWRIASLASAAVLALITLATFAAFLRLDDDDQGGVGTMLPFVPGTALASPTPVAGCATDDTLLVMPEESVDSGAFAHLPFPVAWYADDTITVEHRGNVQREIHVENVDVISATGWPDVLVTGTTEFPDQRGFVNITTGDVVEVGQSVRDVYTPGPFHFWSPTPELNEWNLIDLRTFEHISLNDRFAFDPDRPWAPSVFFGQYMSQDGTVLLVESTLASSISVPSSNGMATPTNSDLPPFDVASNALLVDGSLDAVSAVGPLAIANGDMALSPNGETMAWLAPSEIAGERILTIAESSSTDILETRSIPAHQQPSIRFTHDSDRLVIVSGTTLDVVQIRSGDATLVGDADSTQLPEEGFRLIAMTADAHQVLLGKGNPTVDDTGELLWIDRETGITREFTGQYQPGQLLAPGSIRTAATVGTHVVLDDFESTLHVLELETGEITATMDRIAGRGALTVLDSSDRLLIPRSEGIDILDLNTGIQETIAVQHGSSDPPWVFTATDQQCSVALQHVSGIVEAAIVIDPASGMTFDLHETRSAWWLASSP